MKFLLIGFLVPEVLNFEFLHFEILNFVRKDRCKVYHEVLFIKDSSVEQYKWVNGLGGCDCNLTLTL